MYNNITYVMGFRGRLLFENQFFLVRTGTLFDITHVRRGRSCPKYEDSVENQTPEDLTWVKSWQRSCP